MTREGQLPRPGGAAPGGDASGRDLPEAQRTHAQHGYVNEVRWTTGQDHQPYANQGEEEARAPNLSDEYGGGDRGAHSGVNQAQSTQVRGKP